MVTLLICLLIKCNLFAKKFLFTQGSTYNLGTEAIFEQFQWKGLYPITPYCRWRAIHSYCVQMHFEGNFYPNAVVECGVWAMTRHQWLDDLLGRMITHENSYKLPLIDKLVSVSWILDINNYGKTRGLSQPWLVVEWIGFSQAQSLYHFCWLNSGALPDIIRVAINRKHRMYCIVVEKTIGRKSNPLNATEQ